MDNPELAVSVQPDHPLTVNAMIPWAAPHYWGREREYVLEALDSSWISGGPFVDRFERHFEEQMGAGHALAVSNGTTALHLAFMAIGIKPGDEIIVPGFCFQAAANVALQMGATPVFAEVDSETWCVTADTIDQCLTARTRAAVPVHTYGNVAPMTDIVAWGKANNVAIVEDAAEALGSEYAGRPAGTLGLIGTYSFHATKTITTGEGGMVVTNSDELAKKMGLFRSHGMGAKKYWHEVPGHNFRLTNLQAALGCGQLEHLSQIRDARVDVHRRYQERLSSVPGLDLQRFCPDVTPLLWAMAVKLDPAAYPQGRDTVLDQLARSGIEARPGFYAASLQPIYSVRALPRCEALSEQVLSVPTYPALASETIDVICDTLLDLRS